MRNSSRKPVPANGLPFPDPSNPALYLIPLNGGQHAAIDAADRPIALLHHWTVGRGCVGPTNILYSDGAKRTLQLRRLIMNASDGQLVKMIDNDQLNCRRSNLQLVPKGKPRCWARKPRTSWTGEPPTSNYKGVCFCRFTGRRRAYLIGSDHRWKHIGRFDTEIAAARAYDDAAKAYAGDFARLNFPDNADPTPATSAMRFEQSCKI